MIRCRDCRLWNPSPTPVEAAWWGRCEDSYVPRHMSNYTPNSTGPIEFHPARNFGCIFGVSRESVAPAPEVSDRFVAPPPEVADPGNPILQVN